MRRHEKEPVHISDLDNAPLGIQALKYSKVRGELDYWRGNTDIYDGVRDLQIQ